MESTTTETVIPKVFDFDGSAVRVIDRAGNPWFIAKDVCDILELANSRQAITDLDDDEKGSVRISDGTSPKGGNPNVNLISESGLYTLVFKSRMPKAKAFRRWVTSEVLPSIRKTGEFMLGGQGESEPPVPIEHPAAQFLAVIDAIRARGVSTEKALYSVGCLFQSSLAGAYQSSRQILPMILPPDPKLPELPASSRSKFMKTKKEAGK